ncbi:putative inorganic carbon transporter subunit DabA, partial [Falsiroseomonas oryziterrae]|uniref:putative inorganic carbon transporter subunit DabA n=1 Tax=Falsiroseomonas oryziterrae TaxID=2911368 RepID=UPI001F3DA89C
RLGRLPGGAVGDAVAGAAERAADWAQPRVEWALARNAAFIIADRGFTRHLDLEGRCFLHSYDWQADAEGAALEVILTAPMVVAEWINTQYYFSTVDNAVFGAGSKVTHNVVGGFGVMQGNASDLMTGLPAQSVQSADGVPYHEPLRLMTVVRAPRARVEALIAKHRILQTLFNNGWVALLVADPVTGRFERRSREGHWQDALPAAQAAPALVAA